MDAQAAMSGYGAAWRAMMLGTRGMQAHRVHATMASLPAPTARAVALALLAACAPREVRPVRGAELAAAAADADGNLVLVFASRDADASLRHGHLAYHTAAGPIRWQFALAEDDNFYADQWPKIIGGSVLFDQPRGGVPHSILHIRLADATSHILAPRIEAGTHASLIGDDAAIFAIWHGPNALHERPLELAAFDPATGERTWTATDLQFGLRLFLRARLDPHWLLYTAGDTDWQALRRSDGARVPLPIADPPGLCRAAGRWWAARDDQLVALDLRGDVPSHRASPAAFVPSQSAHQWSITGCGERPDEVVLHIATTTGTGMIVGIDPTTLTPRWTLDLPYAPSPPWIEAGPPRPLGPTTIVTNDGEDPCAIDLVAHRLLWCSSWYRAEVYSDGDDVILRGEQREMTPSHWTTSTDHASLDRDTHFVRIRGSDAAITAAISVQDGAAVSAPLHDGKLWLRLNDSGFTDTELPLALLDARTLQSVTPIAFGRAAAASRVRDATAELDVIFPRTLGVPPRSDPSLRPSRDLSAPSRSINPWDEMMLGPAGAAPPPSRPTATHDAIFAFACTVAGLPADTPIRLLGWRGDDVVGFAETHDSGVTRWTLVRGTQPADSFVTVRTFTRRPTEADLHRFLFLVSGKSGAYKIRSEPDPPRGVTDEAAWLDLVGTPRTQRWLLHTK